MRLPGNVKTVTSEPATGSDSPSEVFVDLARALQAAGLEWHPRQGDRFFVPDRGLDEFTFAISDMVVEVRNALGGGRELAFNGTVEWALDSIMKTDVVWLPTEAQLRTALGDDFMALHPEDDGMVCVARVDGRPTTFLGPTAAEAYGKALLATLRNVS